MFNSIIDARTDAGGGFRFPLPRPRAFDDFSERDVPQPTPIARLVSRDSRTCPTPTGTGAAAPKRRGPETLPVGTPFNHPPP